jgi:hypothetical protein
MADMNLSGRTGDVVCRFLTGDGRLSFAVLIPYDPGTGKSGLGVQHRSVVN